MSVAAQAMAWMRRMGGGPGPLGASGEASTGLPVTVEMLINGAWADVTDYVMVRDNNGNISITQGIRDEGSQTDPATCSMDLVNTDGRFSPRNPSGPYYGLIGRNTPIRVSVPDGMGGKNYRIWGEASEWAPDWDTSGSDVWTALTVGGLTRRLGQAPTPERSVIYEAVTDPMPSSIVAYWPCEDPTDSRNLATALATGSPMTWTGTPALATYEGFTASDPLPVLSSASLSGGVSKYADPAATQVRFLATIPVSGLTDGKVLCGIDQFDTGATQFWELYFSASSNSLTLRQNAGDGSLLGAELPHTFDVRGRQLYVSVEFQEVGANISRTIRLVDVPTGQVYSVNDTSNLTQ